MTDTSPVLFYLSLYPWLYTRGFLTNHHIFSLRSVRQGVANVWGAAAEEKKDLHQEEHTESRLQRSHRFRRSPWKHRPDQPADCGDGLWPVSGAWRELLLLSHQPLPCLSFSDSPRLKAVSLGVDGMFERPSNDRLLTYNAVLCFSLATRSPLEPF